MTNSTSSSINHISTDLFEYLPEVCRIAQEAGSFIKSQLQELADRDIQVKDFNSLVSFVDIKAEELIVKQLRKILPEAGFVTEECTTRLEESESDLVWIIDPLDGTTNFIHKIPFFSVSIALRYQGIYILGVVHDIMHDQTFFASHGQGAFLNHRQIIVSPETKLSESVLATGFPYNSFAWLERYLNLFRELFQETRGIRRIGSAALDLCYVAQGSFAGFYEYGLNEWDVAAGICIVREAGGMISDFSGGDDMVDKKNILATNGHIHSKLQQTIQKHFIR